MLITCLIVLPNVIPYLGEERRGSAIPLLPPCGGWILCLSWLNRERRASTSTTAEKRRIGIIPLHSTRDSSVPNHCIMGCCSFPKPLRATCYPYLPIQRGCRTL